MAYVPVEVTDEKLAELEAQHEDILVLKGSERAPWLLVVRRPNRQETIGYKHHAKRDSTTASEALMAKITIYPTGDDFAKQVAKWAFLCDAALQSDAFQDFLGLTVDAQVK